jgi:hypothetical protein
LLLDEVIAVMNVDAAHDDDIALMAIRVQRPAETTLLPAGGRPHAVTTLRAGHRDEA